MAGTKETIQELFGPAAPGPQLPEGDRVTLRFDDGKVAEATVVSLPGRAAADRVAAKSKTWTRWAGSPDGIIALTKKIAGEISARSSERPPMDIRLALKGNDEERYADVDAFERDIQSQESGSPGARLREVQAIYIGVGPSGADALKATVVFGGAGVELGLEGADRTVVSGLKEEIASAIDAGRPRIPALPGPVHMFVGGLIGFAYAYGLSQVDWGFLPDGVLGVALFALLYLCGFIAAIYALIGGMRAALPGLTLARDGEASPRRQMGLRAMKISGPVCLAVLPFVLQKLFGG